MAGGKDYLRRAMKTTMRWSETITTLSETLRFTYSETLGKWSIDDLVSAISYLMWRQGNLQVASVYAGTNCVQLRGPEIIEELKNLLRLLTLCMLFSKNPFPVFLESAGYSQADVLLQEDKARLLKPAFTILCDKNSKCLLLLIRGTHSIKDTLTVATGAAVSFHHSVLHDGGISNLVLGYAHHGMVAAARWIAKLSSPVLLKALDEYPDYRVQVFGHSLGGGIAAILTYVLRERKEFSSSTCVTFAPAACMTWDLAESGKHFITTIINGFDMVPTFSTSSVDDFHHEVTASKTSARTKGADAVESKRPISSSDVSESHRFYPPGRIMHIVSVPSSDADNLGHDGSTEEHVRIYKTPRDLYSKLRLTRTMTSDHHMRPYKKMMELLIRELENDGPAVVQTNYGNSYPQPPPYPQPPSPYSSFHLYPPSYYENPYPPRPSYPQQSSYSSFHFRPPSYYENPLPPYAPFRFDPSPSYGNPFTPPYARYGNQL